MKPFVLLADGWVVGDVADWTFCPECFEVECDDECPLWEHRHAARKWIER